MAAAAEDKVVACVTGAGGFLASWVVKLLLSKEYIVHGTVRQPSDHKNAHLYKLEKASENLKLFKADLMDYNSLYPAIQRCSAVFHVASPVPFITVPNPQEELLDPAIKGTLNVLEACREAKVKRVVVVSSVSAVFMNPSWPKERPMDETCWSDKDYCRTTKNWYCLSKTEAESEAFDFAKTNGLDVVTVCPALILGPILQPTVNSSSLVLLKLFKESLETRENRMRHVVDVRNVAEAVVLVFEKPEAQGRYICSAHTITTRDLVDKLRRLFPDYTFPQNFTEVEKLADFSSEKLQRLGWSYRPLEETLVGSVESYRKAGLLD